MNRSLMLLLAVLVVALAAVGPAGALSSEGIPAKLDAPGVSAKSSAKTHTCQAGDTKEKVKSHSAIVGNARKTPVVACEQPPRSELLGPGLKQAAANALAALG
jgi:hypothetical protein